MTSVLAIALALAPAPKPKCDATLWSHVYHPQRLKVIKSCTEVAGTIMSIWKEKDGDAHIRLRVDSQYRGLLDSDNVSRQAGFLVVEPVCEYGVTQPDAIAACRNWHDSVVVPKVGAHVRVVGSLVHDMDHGGWAEIHPVTSVTVIPK